MVQEHWLQLIMKLLLGYNMNMLFSGGGINLSWSWRIKIKNLVGGSQLGGIFQGGGMSKFLAGPSPQ